MYETATAILLTLLAVAGGIERAVEVVKAWSGYTDRWPRYQAAIDMTLAAALGVLACWLWQIDPLAGVMPGAPDVARIVLAGLLASAGSATWHGVIETLRALKPQ